MPAVQTPPTPLQARSRFTALRQHRGPDDPAVHDAARDLAAAKIAAYASKVLDAAPPLTDEQRARIVATLRTAGPIGGAA